MSWRLLSSSAQRNTFLVCKRTSASETIPAAGGPSFGLRGRNHCGGISGSHAKAANHLMDTCCCSGCAVFCFAPPANEEAVTGVRDSTQCRFSRAQPPVIGLILEDSFMTHRWLAPWQRGAKKSRSLRGLLCVESLEERSLLSGLHVVSSPQIARRRRPGLLQRPSLCGRFAMPLPGRTLDHGSGYPLKDPLCFESSCHCLTVNLTLAP